MAAVMRHMNVQGERDFSPDEPSVRRVMGLVAILFGKVWNYSGAILEGGAEELDDNVLAGRGRQSWRRGVFQTGTELVVRCRDIRDMRDQFAKVHGFGVRPETILFEGVNFFVVNVLRSRQGERVEIKTELIGELLKDIRRRKTSSAKTDC